MTDRRERRSLLYSSSRLGLVVHFTIEEHTFSQRRAAQRIGALLQCLHWMRRGET